MSTGTMQEQLEQMEATQQDRFLTFSIADETYGIDIYYVIEIIGMQPITAMPDFPAYIRGVINLRGKIIPVMDIRLRFGKPDRAYDERTCIIVIDIKGTQVGLIVDQVEEVLDIDQANIEPPPEFSGHSHNCLKAIGKVAGAVKLLLDYENLLGEEELIDENNIEVNS